jgi:hypothetical protein
LCSGPRSFPLDRFKDFGDLHGSGFLGNRTRSCNIFCER